MYGDLAFWFVFTFNFSPFYGSFSSPGKQLQRRRNQAQVMTKNTVLDWMHLQQRKWRKDLECTAQVEVMAR